MNNLKKSLVVSLLSLSVAGANAAGNPEVEVHVQGFLDTLAAGKGKPIEQLSPKIFIIYF